MREYGDLGALAFGVLAGRVGPDLAEPAVRRLEHAVVDRVERRGRMRELAQHELHDLAGLRLRHDEADHALQHGVELRRRRGGAASAPALSMPKAWLATGLDRVDDEVGAGRAQPFLAAEMIGDRADIGVGGRGDLARRGAVEALRCRTASARRGSAPSGSARRRAQRRCWNSVFGVIRMI